MIERKIIPWPPGDVPREWCLVRQARGEPPCGCCSACVERVRAMGANIKAAMLLPGGTR